MEIATGPGISLIGAMRAGTALCIYLIFVFAGAALLAPWVYFGLHELAAHSATFKSAAGVPLSRVVNRCLLILALVGIWPLIKTLGFRSWSEIGIRRDHKIGLEFIHGLFIGTILLTLAAAGAILSGSAAYEQQTASKMAKYISNALASGLAVALLEEMLFRGAIFTALRKTWNNAAALWVSSAIYGIVHFFGRPQSPAHIDWTSGFTILGGMLAGFGEPRAVIPGFLSLTLLGVILALAFQRSGALFLSMGIHAALVFWLKIYSVTTNPVPNANIWFWGGEKLIDGWFCFILLAATALWFRPKKNEAV